VVRGNAFPALEIKVRFLRIIDRTIGQLDQPVLQWPADMTLAFKIVPTLVADRRVYHSWQEAGEQEISIQIADSDSVTLSSSRHEHTFPAERNFEPIEADGQFVGVVVRDKKPLAAPVEVGLERCHENVWKITVRVCNITPFDIAGENSREHALESSLVSVHTILGGKNCEFVSLLEPPDELKVLASSCQNTGTWPVLIGEPGSHDTMLSSPIILYDYPQIAPESAGDLFDGCEIDEILSLRIMTMTDEEKREMRDSDDRARQILERTEALPAEQLMKLHGVLRNLRPLDKEAS
jgi:hydrogenase maturation protease